ncbi:MAG: glycosyltransferase family 39 protein [Acidobacteriaceae bacterium]
MDELLTWKEVSDPSLWHLYSAIQHGADGGMPVFYTTAWLWAKAFGTDVLTLRLYSCIAMCGALLVAWSTMRRFYGMWATAFGVLAFWGTSGVLLDQNAEARFYGLFMLAVAVAVNVYVRLVMQPAPNRRLLVLSFLSQAVLVLTHVLGIFYGGLILLALIVSDATRRWFRPRVYLSHAAGWLALLVWVPAIRASMAAGKPRVWMVMPTVKFLVVSYIFDVFGPWFELLRHQPHQAPFQLVRQATEWGILITLALIFLLGLRELVKSGPRSGPAPRKALLLIAYLLLTIPVVLFVLSHLINPIFVPRYFLPCGIGVAIILADFADRLGADSPASSRMVWGSIVAFFVVSPVALALSLPPVAATPDYLDVAQVDHVVTPNIPVVVGWQQDFSRLMRFSLNPQTRYYFLLDWPAALAGPRAFVIDYHLMRAYRDNDYYSRNIQDSQGFLCSHPDFLVLNAEQHSWFDLTIRRMPQFEWKVIDFFDALDPKRTLIAVHRRVPLDFCNQP